MIKTKRRVRMNLIIFFTLFVAVHVVALYKFPENFKRCHRSDPDIDNCLKAAIQNAFKIIGSTGISSLSLPSIDPLEIASVEIGAGTSAVNLVQKYRDIKILGFSDCTVEDAHLDLGKKTLTFTMHLPKIVQEAKYEIDGKIMVMPVFGKGDSVLSLFDVTVGHILTFEEETKNNKPHFKVISYILSINPNGADYVLDNLFNGDKKLAANILKVLNDNWKDIFQDVKEGLEKSYSEIFKAVANRLFRAVPVHEIFLN